VLTAAVFDAKGDALRDTHEGLHRDGYRLVSLSMFGQPEDLRYAALWHQTWGPEQVLVRDIPWSDFTAVTMDRPAQDGMYAALVAAVAHPSLFQLFAVVFEAFTPLPGQKLPRIATAPSGGAMQSALLAAHAGLFTRGVAATGRRRTQSSPGSGSDTWYVATLWPQSPGAPWRSTGFRSEPESPDWRFQWPAIVMRSHAHVAIAGGGTSRSGEPDEAFSVWTDERFDPWPEGDSFAIDPHAIGNLLRVDRGNLQAILAHFASRETLGFFPLSLTAHGESPGTATWHAVWAPPHAWKPLTRKFLVQGPGDGSNSVDHDDTHIRLSRRARSLFGPVRRAGRSDVSRVGSLYDVEELRPGHFHLRPLGALPRGTTLRNGPGGPGGAGSEYETAGDGPVVAAEPAGPQLPAVHPFDAVMRKLMRRGARAGYLVVLRHGELKFARAYTYAEEGYPIATIDNRFRVASVSKPMIATMVIRQALSIPGGLQAKFGAALGVTPYFKVLRQATVEHAIRHATGCATTNGPAIPSDAVLRLANTHAESRALEELGTIRYWYGGTHEDVQVPYETHYLDTGERLSAYNNWVYACLGELFAKRDPDFAEYKLWPGAVAKQLRLAGASLQDVLGGRSYAQCRERNEVLYHWRPAVSPRRWHSAEEPLPFVPVPYDVDVDALGCAGSIVVSPIDMARFLAALTPRPGRFSWLSKEDLPLLYSRDPTIPGSGGLGWGHANKSWVSGTPSGSVTVHGERLEFGGGTAGTSSYVRHFAPHSLSFATDTFSFAFAVNASIPTADIWRELEDVAQSIESAGTWPNGDLLDAV